MRTWPLRLFVSIGWLYSFNSFIALAGLNQYTEIDSYKKWSIEQKFDLKKNTVSCRASKSGHGTWFSEKIRLDRNDKVLIPAGVAKKSFPSKEDLEEIHNLLKKCRSGLLYID